MEQGKTGSVLSCGVRSTRWVRLALGHAYVKASGVRCAGPCTCRVWRLRGKAHFSLKEATVRAAKGRYRDASTLYRSPRDYF
jgi:hypothetical protein